MLYASLHRGFYALLTNFVDEAYLLAYDHDEQLNTRNPRQDDR